DPPPSGVPLGIPATFDVDLTPGRAHLSVALDDEQDPVMARTTIKYTIAVDNGGPDPAILPEVSLALDDQLTDPLAGGDGWTCGHAAGLVTCEREVLAPGPADRISVYVTAPGVAGLVTSTVTVTSQNQTTPAEDTETTLVIDDYMTDLGIVKEDGGVVAVPGGPLTYWITVTNNGPKPVKGATVTDYFPWEVHSVAWSCWATAESSCTQSGNGDIVDIVDLLVGGTLIYTATSIVIDDDAIMDIRNIATVAPPSTMIDYNRENDESVLRTPLPVPGIFADGFESGDLSAWPSARKSPVIQLRDEARDDPGIYRGRFTL
ncbi:MAG: DUF11 domain-containing protein, partial [bacterium]|nr:DUF11 domain-containing protein [bacterium]